MIEQVHTKDVGGMSTAEVMELTGLPRSKLLVYVNKGIVTPRRASSADQSKLRWTLEQAWLVSAVSDLLDSGISLDEIAELADQGMTAVLERLERWYITVLRASRRGRKSVAYRMREIDDIASVRARGDYLRYIPQRYLALIPIPGAQAPVRGPSHNASIVELMNTARAMGWCCTNSYGFISSISADGESSSFYGFNLLASPPMPTFTGMKAVDGGCYRLAAGDGLPWPCHGVDCDTCTRFGHTPSQSTLFEWNGQRANHPELWSGTVMAAELSEPYPTGLWSEFTQGPQEPRSDEPQGKSATVRPRKMPHFMPLPLGVTACVLPAGIYLCRQCEDESRENTFTRMLGQASFMPQREFTVEDELRKSAQLSGRSTPRSAPESGPVPEPFAVARIEGDPALKGWWQELTNEDARKLIVPTNMALSPEDGFCIACTALPVSDRDDSPRYEVQLLVDASETTTPPQACPSVF